MSRPGVLGPRGGIKPCACGRDGCFAVQREDEQPNKWAKRRYANLSCVSWKKNMDDPRMQAARAKGATSDKRGTYEKISDNGALVTSVAWLFRPSGRIQALRRAHGIVVND